MDIIKNVTAILVLLGIIFSAYFYVDKTYAQKQQVVGIMEQFKKDMAKDRLEQNYINAVNIERQYKALVIQNPQNQDIKNELREITKEKNELKKQLDESMGFK